MNWLLVKSKPATKVIPQVFILVILVNGKVRKAKDGIRNVKKSISLEMHVYIFVRAFLYHLQMFIRCQVDQAKTSELLDLQRYLYW